MNGVMVNERSGNKKTGPVSTTSVSQASCPKTCPYLNNGCYAEYGHQAMMVTRKVNGNGGTSKELATAEARAIKNLSGRRPLRLHVVGDCRTNTAALVVARACAEYSGRYDSAVWTYTHAWRTVARASWGSVSVLASCENLSQVRDAQARGYATALVVGRFEDIRNSDDGRHKALIPCPEQSGKGVTCIDCKLCWKDLKNKTIVFEAHGQGATKVKEVVK